jgi:hypothetical protein
MGMEKIKIFYGKILFIGKKVFAVQGIKGEVFLIWTK